MLDIVELNPPAVLKDMEEATRAIDFTMGSDAQTGSLLRTLAASKPIGTLLELGTGTGLGTAWILDGMGPQAQLITVDRGETAPAVARGFLSSDPRVTFYTGDGAEFLKTMREQGRLFDFIFADMHPGKFAQIDDALALLAPGGIYVIDDLLLLTSWKEEHALLVHRLISTLEQRTDLRITKLNWSTGLIVATKIA
ncbi:MAG TPA: class I SAM-dependent methyltransferase [Ktedonobacteraceae bacterium]|nr:class I SAM-dependent methyltransferase [Ktedonobacteraceae bacterium]